MHSICVQCITICLHVACEWERALFACSAIFNAVRFCFLGLAIRRYLSTSTAPFIYALHFTDLVVPFIRCVNMNIYYSCYHYHGELPVRHWRSSQKEPIPQQNPVFVQIIFSNCRMRCICTTCTVHKIFELKLKWLQCVQTNRIKSNWTRATVMHINIE